MARVLPTEGHILQWKAHLNWCNYCRQPAHAWQCPEMAMDSPPPSPIYCLEYVQTFTNDTTMIQCPCFIRLCTDMPNKLHFLCVQTWLLILVLVMSLKLTLVKRIASCWLRHSPSALPLQEAKFALSCPKHPCLLVYVSLVISYHMSSMSFITLLYSVFAFAIFV